MARVSSYIILAGLTAMLLGTGAGCHLISFSEQELAGAGPACRSGSRAAAATAASIPAPAAQAAPRPRLHPLPTRPVFGPVDYVRPPRPNIYEAPAERPLAEPFPESLPHHDGPGRLPTPEQGDIPAPMADVVPTGKMSGRANATTSARTTGHVEPVNFELEFDSPIEETGPAASVDSRQITTPGDADLEPSSPAAACPQGAPSPDPKVPALQWRAVKRNAEGDRLKE